MNLHYAKFVNGQLIYAPSTITTPRGDLIVNPKRLSYLQAGYKQLIDEPPVAPRGKSAALSRYEETADTITAIYKLVPCAESPRTISKLRLVAALDAQGLWQSFRDWMVEQEYYDLFLARALAGGLRRRFATFPRFARRISQDFREDHPSFTEVRAAAQSRFHLTDEQIAALLDASVSEG